MMSQADQNKLEKTLSKLSNKALDIFDEGCEVSEKVKTVKTNLSPKKAKKVIAKVKKTLKKKATRR